MSKKVFQFFLFALVGACVLVGTVMWTKVGGTVYASGNNYSPKNSAWILATGNDMAGDVTRLYQINSTNFPDEYFRTSISRDLDRNHDGYLSTREVREAKEFRPDWSDDYYDNIESLKGIEKFTNLKLLYLDNACVSEVDLSKNTRLEALRFSSMPLEKLDLSKNSYLKSVNVDNCELSELILCPNGALISLSCDGACLSELTVPASVENLYCSCNELTRINFAPNGALKYFNCYGNCLSSLDLTNVPDLQNCYCYDNQLEEIIFPAGTKVNTLNCSNNAELTDLDLRNARELSYLECGFCNLSNLNVSKCAKLSYFDAINNSLTNLSLPKSSDMHYLDVRNNNLDVLDIRNCSSLIQIYLGTAYSWGACYVDEGTAVIYLDAPEITELVQDGYAIYLRWSEVAGADGYAVYRKGSDGVTNLVGNFVGGTEYVTQVSSLGETFTYTVQCTDYDTLPISYPSKGKSIVEYTVIDNPVVTAKNTADGVKITWDKCVDAAKYRVLRAEGSGAPVALAKVSTNSYIDKNAESGKRYVYSVLALNSAGKVIGEYDSVSIKAVELKCVKDLSLKTSDQNIKLSWSAVEGVAKYRVMRKEEGGSFAAIAKIADTSYTDKNVIAGKTYYYTVRCMDESGSYIGTYDSTGKSIVAPTVIVGPTVSVQNTQTGVSVTWNSVAGISKYRVLRKETGGAFAALAKVSGTSYTDKSAEPGKTYYYTVRCLDASSAYVGTYDQSGKKITVPEATLPAPEVTVSNGKDGIEINWNAIDGAAKYRVLKRDVTGAFVALAKVSGTNYVDADVVNGETYCYTIRCIGADGKYVGNYNTEGVSIVRQTAVELQAEIQAASVNGEGIALVWTGGETVASKYRVLRKEGNGEFQAIAKVSQTGYLDKNVEIGKTYTYTIRLIGSDGKYIGTYDQTGFTVSYNP